MSDIAAEQLRSFVERIERVEADIKEMNADKSDIYKEAKGNGFDVGILRKLIAERRKPEAELNEEEAILDLYRQALSRAHVHEAA